MDTAAPRPPRGDWAERVFAAAPDQPFGLGFTFGTLHHVMTPPRTPPGVVYEHIQTPDVRMHIYRHSSGGARPFALFVHGGSWSAGDPLMMIRHAHFLASRGYVAASAGYRLCPPDVWPACFDDVRGAVRWVRTHAAELGVDPGRIGIAGESAGAHLAAMTALADEGVGAAVLWSVPSDLQFRDAIPNLPEIGNRVLGTNDPDALWAASPIAHVGPHAPPMLILTGRDDPVTPLAMIEPFHKALVAAGSSSRLEIFPGSHGFDVADLTLRERTFALTAEFFDEHLR